MTTEPKDRIEHAEGGEAVATYGMRRKGTTAIIGVVPEKIHAQPLDPKRSADYMRDYEEVPLYTHPSPSAVEALARAADAIAERISYYAELGEHASTNIEDWAYTDGSGDIARLRAALAHPEIAALLKGEKK